MKRMQVRQTPHLERLIKPTMYVFRAHQDGSEKVVSVMVNGFMLHHAGSLDAATAANDNQRKTAIEFY